MAVRTLPFLAFPKFTRNSSFPDTVKLRGRPLSSKSGFSGLVSQNKFGDADKIGGDSGFLRWIKRRRRFSDASFICCAQEVLAENYPRGNKELQGSFFKMHGPLDTISWFSDLLLQTGKVVTSASRAVNGKFVLKIEKFSVDLVEAVEADYLLIATGSSRQGHSLAVQLGHSIVEPMPSLFTFKINDTHLLELSGVGPMLVTHWGLSGPVILQLSAWGARELFRSNYTGTIFVDFVPNLHFDNVKCIFTEHKKHFGKQKVHNSSPPQLGLVKRFWNYLLDREGIDGDVMWACISNHTLISIASLLKHCNFKVNGKGKFKDEFVTSGGVPLSEVLNYLNLCFSNT
ncbi:hypothetical protein AMTRI_Chr06g196010 [Amborella trichopoda]